MIKRIDSVLIGSANAEKLAEFYREIVGIPQGMEFEMGEKGEKGFSFDFGDQSIVILDHSGVSGKNKNPERFMLNLEVGNIEKEFEKLKKAKVKVQQEIYHIEGYGMIATFVDPEGNYFQLVQIRATN